MDGTAAPICSPRPHKRSTRAKVGSSTPETLNALTKNAAPGTSPKYKQHVQQRNSWNFVTHPASSTDRYIVSNRKILARIGCSSLESNWKMSDPGSRVETAPPLNPPYQVGNWQPCCMRIRKQRNTHLRSQALLPRAAVEKKNRSALRQTAFTN